MISIKNVLANSFVLLIGISLGAYLTYGTLSSDSTTCPIDSSWGSCLEVVTILVGILNACAVIYLSWQANKIAFSGRNEQKRSEFREGKILLSYVVPELREALLDISVAQHLIGEEEHRNAYAMNQNARRQISQILSNVSFPLTESILPRMHVMPDLVGSSLAQLLGVTRAVNMAANSATARATPGAVQNMFGELVEPVDPTQEALEEFAASYRVITSGVKLMGGEIERLIEVNRILMNPDSEAGEA